MLTGRDAAHKRIVEMLAQGDALPVDFTNRVIYYVGPVDPVRDEVVGPAGPTTATRMDKFTDMMLAKTGLIAMIGKAERGPVAIDAIRKHRAAYLMAVGGAAYLVSKAIRHSRVLAFADLGMEAIYEFDVVTCRSRLPSTRTVNRCTTPVRASGRNGLAGFRWRSCDELPSDASEVELGDAKIGIERRVVLDRAGRNEQDGRSTRHRNNRLERRAHVVHIARGRVQRRKDVE